MILLTCQDVSLSYGQKKVLERVNFSLEEGICMAIIGENGCGKSTLMKGILGLKRISGGSIQFSPKIRRGDIGYLPQHQEEQKNFPASVMEVIQSGRLSRLSFPYFYSRRDYQDIGDIMKALSINHLASACLHDLSGGQQQRVLLARALAAGNRILFLDEPMTGLDIHSTESLYLLLRELRKKYHLSILMVSHDMPRVLAEADQILYLAEGAQRFYGSSQDFLHSSNWKGMAEQYS